jgi:hypothetical protein
MLRMISGVLREVVGNVKKGATRKLEVERGCWKHRERGY